MTPEAFEDMLGKDFVAYVSWDRSIVMACHVEPVSENERDEYYWVYSRILKKPILLHTIRTTRP